MESMMGITLSLKAANQNVLLPCLLIHVFDFLNSSAILLTFASFHYSNILGISSRSVCICRTPHWISGY